MFVFIDILWFRVVFDEGYVIRNFNVLMLKVVFVLKSEC